MRSSWGGATVWERLDLPETVNEVEVVVAVTPGTATRFFRLRETGLTHLVSGSPDHGEAGVSVTRATILHFDRPLAADTLLTLDRLHAEAGGRRLLGRVELSSDRRTVTLFPLEPLPGSTRVTVSFDSNGLQDQVGTPVDGDRDG